MSTAKSTVKFIPVDAGTPQDTVSKRLAVFLAENGVDGQQALPMAIEILAGAQAALDSGNVEDAVREWDAQRLDHEEFWLTHHPDSKTAHAIALKRLAAGVLHPVALRGKLTFGVVEQYVMACGCKFGVGSYRRGLRGKPSGFVVTRESGIWHWFKTLREVVVTVDRWDKRSKGQVYLAGA